MLIVAPLYTTEFSDCIVSVGDPENHVKYEAHRHILCIQSPVFKVGLTNENFKESVTREFSLPDFRPATIERILAWMYGLPIELPNNMRNNEDFDFLTDIWPAIDYRQLNGIMGVLLKRIEKYVSVKPVLKETAAAMIRLMNTIYKYGDRIDDDHLQAYLGRVRAAGQCQEIVDYIYDVDSLNPSFLKAMSISLLQHLDKLPPSPPSKKLKL
ncbi:hypothetical protein AA313_de0201337 [Arthrobotrys entomopaga]|nr:hypothetical protein AA313_de0201337 [Arthrobotrys entomopaga]